MKNRVGIITIIDENYGNRLQNYALQEYLKEKGFAVKTIHYREYNKFKKIIKSSIKKYFLCRFNSKYYNYIWDFFNFNIDWSDVNIPYESRCVPENIKEKFDYFVVGSDQVWNPNFYYFVPRSLLEYADDNQKIAFAASFGVSNIPEKNKEEYSKSLSSFKALSVREDAGANIIKTLTGRDAKVLLDPTMLISKEKWIIISKKSKFKPKYKYVVKYFLGSCSKEYNDFIEKKANELGAKIIDIFNTDSSCIIGPNEFVYIFEHASAAFVDSFHGTVFSIIFNIPFVSFDRTVINGTGNMNSRMDTLLNTFMLENHRIRNINDISKLDMNIDNKRVQSVLEKKRKEASDFVKESF